MEISLSYILRRFVRFMRPALWRQSRQQQSSRAIEHSVSHMIPRSTAWQLVIASVIAYRNLLPEAL
jgi:ribosomal protein L13